MSHWTLKLTGKSTCPFYTPSISPSPWSPTNVARMTLKDFGWLATLLWSQIKQRLQSRGSPQTRMPVQSHFFPPVSLHVSSMWCESLWGVNNETTRTRCLISAAVRQRKENTQANKKERASHLAICGAGRQPAVVPRAHRAVPFLYRQLLVFTFFTIGTEAPRSPNAARMFLTSRSGGMFIMPSRVFLS